MKTPVSIKWNMFHKIGGIVSIQWKHIMVMVIVAWQFICRNGSFKHISILFYKGQHMEWLTLEILQSLVVHHYHLFLSIYHQAQSLHHKCNDLRKPQCLTLYLETQYMQLQKISDSHWKSPWKMIMLNMINNNSVTLCWFYL